MTPKPIWDFQTDIPGGCPLGSHTKDFLNKLQLILRVSLVPCGLYRPFGFESIGPFGAFLSDSKTDSRG